MLLLACGPYIGSIESEILLFRPFVYWLQLVLKPNITVVSSHYNREFLYENCSFFPVYEDLTRNEFGQIGATHSYISVKDYNLILKKFKTHIQDTFRIQKDFIYYYNLSYVKNPWVPLYKRHFTKINTVPNKKNQILFIPNNTEKIDVIHNVYNSLISRYNNIVCCGDMKTYLPEYNILLKDSTYFQNVYINMVNLITDAKMVITPVSHWSIISDLQGTPSFSWGAGSYPMLSKKSKFINIKNIPVNSLTNMIEQFIGEKNANI